MGRRRRSAKPKQRTHRFVTPAAVDYRGLPLDQCAICSLGAGNACHPPNTPPITDPDAASLTARILGERLEGDL